MVSRTASTCNRYAAGCTKTSAEILWVKRRKKQQNAPDFRRKQPKSGAFWVLERMGTVGNRCERMGKPGVRTKTNPIPMQHMQKENRRKPGVFAGSVAGAEGLEPSARGFGVDVGGSPEERGRGCVGRFLPQVTKRAVLGWCCEKILRVKTGRKARNSIKAPKEIDRKRHGPYNKKRR